METLQLCCPPFDETVWDEKKIVWHEKLFVKDHVTSLFHIPLNFSKIMEKNVRIIQKNQALPEDNMIVLADENSLFGSNVFLETTKEIPDVKMAKISGTFLTKVFEGPYKNMPTWIEEMEFYVGSQDHIVKRMLYYYTTCPKCAKQYGANYVVIFAEV